MGMRWRSARGRQWLGAKRRTASSGANRGRLRPPGDPHAPTCAVDAEGKVRETDEANNLRAISLQVKPVTLPPPAP